MSLPPVSGYGHDHKTATLYLLYDRHSCLPLESLFLRGFILILVSFNYWTSVLGARGVVDVEDEAAAATASEVPSIKRHVR